MAPHILLRHVRVRCSSPNKDTRSLPEFPPVAALVLGAGLARKVSRISLSLRYPHHLSEISLSLADPDRLISVVIAGALSWPSPSMVGTSSSPRSQPLKRDTVMETIAPIGAAANGDGEVVLLPLRSTVMRE
jgi:hypothetical protein